MKPARTVLIFVAIAAGLAAVMACNVSFQAGNQADVTLTALSASIPQTLTALANESGDSGGDLATAQVEATQGAMEIQATQTADASTRDEDQLATATVAAPVVAELPRYNLDPEQGHLGFVHNPVTITVEGYHQFNYANDFMGTTARDFVMAADITWNTQYGASGCGFMFRANGDQQNPDQYLVFLTRMGNGHVLFMAMADGELANVRDIFPKTEDKLFQWQNDTTNRLVVIGRGTIFEIYTNGVKVGEIDVTQPPPPFKVPPAPTQPSDTTNLSAMQDYQNKVKEYKDMLSQMQTNYDTALGNFETKEAIFEEGFVSFVALSESGSTQCKFDKAWLWHLDQ